MGKCMVEIYLPSAKKYYDVRIPEDSKVGIIISLLEKCMEELEPGYYFSGEDSVLCDQKTGVVLNSNSTVKEAGIENGSKLMLV